MTRESIDLLVEDVAYRGRALGRHEGMVIFVRGALPGERIRARIVDRRRNYAVAELVDVVEASDDRCATRCPLATAPGVAEPCPGCAYQHASYDREIAIKQAQLAALLFRNLPEAEDKLQPPVASPSVYGYRNKIVLREGDRGGSRVLGYTADDNRSILDVRSCPLAMGPINDALTRVRADLDEPGHLHRHTFRCTAVDGVVHYRDRERPEKTWLTENTVCGDLTVPARGFFQVNPGLAWHLTEAVMEICADAGVQRVIDAFCGVGVLAFAARRAGAEEVLGIDTDRRCIRAADRNAVALGLQDSAFFMAAKTESGLRKAFRGVSPGRLTLILDPPRVGLTTNDVREIGKGGAKRIIYVSCAADTLARDLVRLRDYGYRMRHGQLFDMFPRTALFETVVVLERG
jgi:23S rRNA (uracil1939-C5)-methyltransferase